MVPVVKRSSGFHDVHGGVWSIGVPEVDPRGAGHGIGILVVAEGHGRYVDGNQETSHDTGKPSVTYVVVRGEEIRD